MNKIKIYCLPYAGGSMNIYNDWIKEYKDTAQIIPVEYSGHGSRYTEELYTSADDMADDIYRCIMADKPQNYMIYGHSMGSLISLLVTIRLEAKYNYKPNAVIIGGTRPPHLIYKDEQIAHLPKQEFLEKIFSMDQMDAEIMNEPELLDLIYDIIYADTILAEEYRGYQSLPKIKSPLVVMTGLKDDEGPEEDMKEWKKYSEGNFELKTFDAGHFFPFKCVDFHDYFVNTINKYK